MSYFYDLSKVEEEIANCMRCGNCQASCPYYRETLSESNVARGRIRLAKAILEGSLPYSPALAERMECMTCYACNAICPCGVKVDKILLAARAALVRQGGAPALKKVMALALKNQRMLDLFVRAAATTKPLFLKKHPLGGHKLRFYAGLNGRRVLPDIAGKNFRDRIQEHITVPGARKTAALFTGCLGNYVYPQTSAAAVDILSKSGFNVVIPRAQHCCGAPLSLNGVVDAAEALARSHADLFFSLAADIIVTICGTCGESFKKKYPELLSGSPSYSHKAKIIAARTCDIAQVACEYTLNGRSRLKELNMDVTYHEPCHLGRGMGVSKEPVQIIQSIPGVNFRPLKEPARCCGNAGSFNITHYGLSLRILKHKLADIESTGAGAVITGCSACRMQLADGMAQEGKKPVIMHTAELLAMSLKA
ncbi:MAG: (Fe-S)-binding protein [Pelotomaculum sp.]|uniref:Glycolate oxidase iron-sulfur subunit n=1 Tax=Pelotomaculum thermopropionicum (strain DSM 13744 / JCM 10971 / SI) TaxID=370438 RepID=A5D028_PELTS|nr:(Fe-S)-binding protein [Pelotomaculum sp.]BAF60412.1 Fe-S oxidoreductase [Pelotomaculum thermopropionicum SI]